MLAPAGDSAIVVTDLTKSYGRVLAVNRISFAVRRGTTTALLGGNGAGKTTTLSMLLGLLTPSAGRATVLGTEMPGERHRVLPRMNFTSPYVDLPKRLTVGENLAVFADLYGVRRARERIAAVAADCDLGDLLRRPYGSLSAGQRTRVSLAKAVLNEPEVLLLDEPTASLDPDIGDRMRTYLERYQRRTECTMLLASHHMGEVERMCDDVIMLRAGVVVDQGSPRALIERYGRETMEEVFLDVARGGMAPPEAALCAASPQGASALGRPGGADPPEAALRAASPQGASALGRPGGAHPPEAAPGAASPQGASTLGPP